MRDVENFENPGIECNRCGESDWFYFEDSTPPSYPQGRDGSDVTRHQYECKNCREEDDKQSHARIYEENGHLRFTGNMR